MKETATIDFDEVGQTTKERYSGRFVIKTLLSARDQLNADAFRRKQLGEDPDNADRVLKAWAGMVAQIYVRVIEAPKWYYSTDYGLELKDYEIVNKLFEKTVEIDAETRKEIAEEAEGARKELKRKTRTEKE
jgi:hypothetical protein